MAYFYKFVIVIIKIINISYQKLLKRNENLIKVCISEYRTAILYH